jgi:hypothetical protein
MEVFAENRSITLSDRFCTLVYKEAGQETARFTGEETGFVEENRAFIKALQDDTPVPIDHVDGLMATLMMVQVGRSLKSGKPEPIAALLEGVR